MGRYDPSRKRPVFISFVYRANAQRLLVTKKKLPRGIYMYQEYTEEIEAKRRYLRPILRVARQSSKYRDSVGWRRMCFTLTEQGTQRTTYINYLKTSTDLTP